ncbi:hypothetical protein ACFVTE_09600 [Arthrobacter sp. NPDC058097]|uniref:hypothetical protein n=1 Tax=Arthrobacter sp. NPDC058097 TaxID=3346340 RepID=UPI0036DFA044
MNESDPAIAAAVPPNPPGRHRVVLRSSAFIKGWFISTVLWLVPVCVIVVVQELTAAVPSESGPSPVPGIAIMVLWYGFGIALVFAAPLAWILGYVLRHVPNQWIHVAVFFAVPTLVFWVLGGLLQFGWTIESLGFWATVGAAAAIGRLAIRRNVELVSAPPRG